MFDLFIKGGVFMWPLLLLAIAVAVLSIKKIFELFIQRGLTKIQLESGVNAILFWGGISAVIGLLGSFSGIFIAAGYLAKASDISPAIVWAGIQVALITTIFGLIIFIIAGILWFILRSRYKKLA